MEITKKLKIIVNNLELLPKLEGAPAQELQNTIMGDITYVSSRLNDEEDIKNINYVYEKLPQLLNKKGKESTTKLLRLKEKLNIIIEKQKYFEE